MASSRRDTDAASVFAGVVGAPSRAQFAVVVVAAVVVVVSTPVVEGTQQGYWCINNTSSQRYGCPFRFYPPPPLPAPRIAAFKLRLILFEFDIVKSACTDCLSPVCRD